MANEEGSSSNRSKFWSRKYNKVIIGFLVGLLIGILIFPSKGADSLTNTKDCPACYGTYHCDTINAASLNEHGWFARQWHKIYDALFFFLQSEQLDYKGLYERQNVIIRRYASKSEFEALDKSFCQDANLELLCKDQKYEDNKGKVVKSLNETYLESLIDKQLTSEDGLLRLCPSANHRARLLRDAFIRRLDYSEIPPGERAFKTTNIYTMIKINPTPLLIQLLSSKALDWPVNKYYGACGRVTMVDYYETTISEAYMKYPWYDRAQIAANLLDTARILTFKDSLFSYYIQYISPETVQVTPEKKVVLTDLKHVIVVDRDPYGNVECTNCSYTLKNICSSTTSDHNYKVICQHLLSTDAQKPVSGGLLYDIPDEVSQKYPKISTLIHDCSSPPKPNGRISVGDELKLLLDTIIQNKNQSQP